VQNGGLVSDISAVLLPDARRRTDLYRVTLTDASGQFHLDRLPPGDYKVFAWDDVDEDAWYDPEFMRMHENEGVAIRIGEGRTEMVRLNINGARR
jgi:hypothetical protein